MTSWSTVGIAVPAALASDRPKRCTPPRTIVPPITMPSFKNVRLSMAQPSNVVSIDCMTDLPHRASRAGSIPHNFLDHSANDEFLHDCPSFASPCWHNRGMLCVRLSEICKRWLGWGVPTPRRQHRDCSLCSPNAWAVTSASRTMRAWPGLAEFQRTATRETARSTSLRNSSCFPTSAGTC